ELLLLGRFPGSRWRSALGEVESVGNRVATSSAAAARACSRRATATWMVWFASSVCFSRADSSSLSKTLHHSPLATPSLGALSRHGSVTSHLAGTGAEARWYFGHTVQTNTKTTAAPTSA